MISKTFSFLKPLFFSLSKKQMPLWLIFYFLIYIVILIKWISVHDTDTNLFLIIYGITVSFYILGNFALSYFHPLKNFNLPDDYRPLITFGVPIKNEEKVIKETLLRIAKCDYPRDKFEIIAINDGSTDQTWQKMIDTKKIIKKMGVSIRLINWRKCHGKLAGLSESLKKANGELIIFIDSDSLVEPSIIKEFVRYFKDETIGGVSGRTFVANANKNVLTKMQVGFYFLSYSVYKAAESIFGTVTCCPGCCSAYRKEYLAGILEEWAKLNTTKFTYVDDRNLTNFVLRKRYHTVYAPKAIAHTYVPEDFRTFFRQQLRWTRSWFLESILASKFMWQRNIVMGLIFYLGLILQLLAPIMVFRALFIFPFIEKSLPYYYIFGVLLMAIISAIYYQLRTSKNSYSPYVFLFPLLYTFVLVWQIPYAIATLGDSRWGNR